ncbi:MAG: carbohydrate ABC transporter permease, partial [Propionibacteriaceae bacterium]
MATVTTAARDRATTGRKASSGKAPDRGTELRGTGHKNYLGGLLSYVWLLIVLIPIYWIIITSFKDQSVYFTTNPMAPPTDPTLANYALVVESDFPRYFLNSVLVTVGAIVPAVLISFLASFAIVRGSGWVLKGINSLLLMGLAIPLQATIIPVYLIIIRLGL